MHTLVAEIENIRENSVIIFGTPNVSVLELINVPLALVVLDFWTAILVHHDTSNKHQDLIRGLRYDNLDTCKRLRLSTILDTLDL